MRRKTDHDDPGQHTKVWLGRYMAQQHLTLSATATALQVSTQTVHRWLHPHYANQFPACLVPAWTRHYGPRLIEWLCARCGGWFQPYPHPVTPTPADTLSAALDVTQASTTFARTFLDVMAQTPITYTDLDAIAAARQRVTQATTNALWLAHAAQAPDERSVA